MDRGQVTEDDLGAGLSSLGGLGSLRRGRRDSPFGPDMTSDNGRDLGGSTPPAASKQEVQAKVRAGPRTARTSKRPRSGEPRREQPSAETLDSTAKVEIYTEKVTVPMTGEMRDAVCLLAARLQRSRTDKSERITANSVIRVAIRVLLAELNLAPEQPVNSEEELLALAALQRAARESSPK